MNKHERIKQIVSEEMKDFTKYIEVDTYCNEYEATEKELETYKKLIKMMKQNPIEAYPALHQFTKVGIEK